MSNLLALDQSSHTTGYSVFINGIIVEVDHFDCIGNDLGDRLEQLRNNVLNLINKYQINEVVFEDIQLQDVQGSKEVGIKTFKILAEAFGVVHELLTELDIKYEAVLCMRGNIDILVFRMQGAYKVRCYTDGENRFVDKKTVCEKGG